MIELEAKVQTIYYQDNELMLHRFYDTSGQKLTKAKAKEFLESQGIEVLAILQIIYERAYLKMDKQTFESAIQKTEKYFKKKRG